MLFCLYEVYVLLWLSSGGMLVVVGVECVL